VQVLIVLNVATAFCVEASLTYMVEAAAERAKQRAHTGRAGSYSQRRALTTALITGRMS
jgi:hypothetical protein